VQAIPKLTQQRLAELPPGTRIRIGRELVTFNSCSVRPNYKGEAETFVEYTDANGQALRHCEFTVLQSATEVIDAVMCKYCGKFRHPDDIVKKVINFWNRTEYHDFCVGGVCSQRFQQTPHFGRTTRIKARRYNFNQHIN